MDSKNIYIACSVMLRKVEWEKVNCNNEWKYVGEGLEFKSKEVQDYINSYFSEDKLYFIVGRQKMQLLWLNLRLNNNMSLCAIRNLNALLFLAI